MGAAKRAATFRVSSREDPETWLERYERTAAFNNRNFNDRLPFVYFALEESARTWFEIRESTMTTWDIFQTSFLAAFTSVVRKQRATTLLEIRVQLPNESVTIFTYEMTRLFGQADMSEEKKGSFPDERIEELFVGLVRDPPKTVSEFVSEATTIEKALEIRTRQYNCRIPTTTYGEVQTLHAIRRFARDHQNDPA